MPRDISIVLKGNYTDRDVKRAIRDLHSLETQGPRTSKALKGIGVGLGIAGAAAAALAVKVGVDSVKAFVDDEAAASKLAKTLENVGWKDASTQAEKWIDDMQFATGVADNDLRPALSKAALVSRDLADAQGMVSLAMDVSAGTGKDLDTVMTALVKAHNGNIGALTRLGIPLDANIVKTKDYDAASKELARTFRGQAATSADTLTGKMKILGIGIDELQESAGRGLVEGFFKNLSNGTGDIDAAADSLRNAQGTADAFGQTIGSMAAGAIGWLSELGIVAMKFVDTWDDAWAGMERLHINAMDFWGEISDQEADAQRKALDAADAQRESAMVAYAVQVSGGRGVGSPVASTGPRYEATSQVPVFNITVTVPPGATLDQIVKEGQRKAHASGGRFSAPGGRYGASGAR